jgi:hypothetical protein
MHPLCYIFVVVLFRSNVNNVTIHGVTGDIL